MSNSKRTRPFRRKLPATITPVQLAAVLRGKAGLMMLEIRHDDGCPAIHTQCADDCICAPDQYIVAPFGLKTMKESGV